MPAYKHGDASAEYIEPCSLLLHQNTASPAERSARVSHVLATEACAFLIHRCLLLLLLVLMMVKTGRRNEEHGDGRRGCSDEGFFFLVWWIWGEGVYGFYISGFNYWFKDIYLKNTSLSVISYHLYIILPAIYKRGIR